MTTLPRALPQLLAPDAATARTARMLVSRLVQPAFPPALVERIMLLTTEVVTNALLHAHPPYSLDVRMDDHAVRVMVHDAAREHPRPRERRLHLDPAPQGAAPLAPPSHDRPDTPTVPCHEIGGWGLEPADAWGSEAAPTGKTVWFEVARPVGNGD